MTNELTVKEFQNNQFGELRAVLINGEPWFSGNDVTSVLQYKNSKDALIKHVDQDDKKILKGRDLRPLNNKSWDIPNRGVTIINESGMYSLILASKLPAAKQFKHWVTSEVLPSIRKNGGYIKATPEMTDEEILAKALLLAKATLDERKKKIEQLTAENNEMKPKAEFADRVQCSETGISIGAMAKLLSQNGIKIGRTRFFAWLRNNGYLLSTKQNWNHPAQQYVDKGIFKIHESTVDMGYGYTPILKLTTYITGKGQQYFMKKFMKGVESIAATI